MKIKVIRYEVKTYLVEAKTVKEAEDMLQKAEGNNTLQAPILTDIYTKYKMEER